MGKKEYQHIWNRISGEQTVLVDIKMLPSSEGYQQYISDMAFECTKVKPCLK